LSSVRFEAKEEEEEEEDLANDSSVAPRGAGAGYRCSDDELSVEDAVDDAPLCADATGPSRTPLLFWRTASSSSRGEDLRSGDVIFVRAMMILMSARNSKEFTVKIEG
jgi:hypothetical protein